MTAEFRPNSEGIGGDVPEALPPFSPPAAPTPSVEDAEIADRARFLARYYSLHPKDALWEEMSPEDAYKRGQVFATRYIRYGSGTEGVPLVGQEIVDTRERWALWFVQCADESTNLPDGERDGLRVAAAHLRNRHVAVQVAAINLGPTVVAPAASRPTSSEETS